MLAHKLGVGDQFIEPGFEDTWYYLWRERRLPVNVDPFDSRLDDEMERARLRRVFTQGLDKTVGYVLPLQSNEYGVGPRWQSGPWFLRDERMYLIPGDSPMGYRLPLDSLPWVSQADAPYLIAQDPLQHANLCHTPPLCVRNMPSTRGTRITTRMNHSLPTNTNQPTGSRARLCALKCATHRVPMAQKLNLQVVRQTV
jgi:uncharacterized protein (DUF2126 family)